MDFVVVPFIVGFFLLAYSSWLEESKNKDGFTRLFTFVIFVFVATGLTSTFQATASRRMQQANENNNANVQQEVTGCDKQPDRSVTY